MYRLSSNLTLVLKFFIPVFWVCFFVSFTVAAWLTDENIGPLGNTYFKIGLTVFTILGIVVFISTFWKLRRIDADKSSIYVSDYFKTARIPWDLVDKVTYTRILLIRVVSVRLKKEGNFGKKFHFLASSQNLREFQKQHNHIILIENL